MGVTPVLRDARLRGTRCLMAVPLMTACLMPVPLMPVPLITASLMAVT